MLYILAFTVPISVLLRYFNKYLYFFKFCFGSCCFKSAFKGKNKLYFTCNVGKSKIEHTQFWWALQTSVYFRIDKYFKMTSSNNFRGEYPECKNEYGSCNYLLRHYRANQQHKPENLENKKKTSAKELVCDSAMYCQII